MRDTLVGFLCGLIFGFGLLISGMLIAAFLPVFEVSGLAVQ